MPRREKLPDDPDVVSEWHCIKCVHAVREDCFGHPRRCSCCCYGEGVLGLVGLRYYRPSNLSPKDRMRDRRHKPCLGCWHTRKSDCVEARCGCCPCSKDSSLVVPR